jgi:hypothetical protein
MRLFRVIPLMLLVSALACEQSPTQPAVTVGQLRAAPTRLTVNNEQVTVQAEVWRNLQPSGDGTSPGIVASIRLSPSGEITVKRVWVTLNNDVWTAATLLVPGTNQWIARDGPRWPVGALTDVVVQVKDANGGTSMVRIAGVLIQGVL